LNEITCVGGQTPYMSSTIGVSVTEVWIVWIRITIVCVFVFQF